jgi:D-arabinose 1-dehydrogenase-like Zn-dependent alcohol dehydrogenase
MKAAVLRDYSLPPAFGDFPEPEPADGGVVVDVAAAGVTSTTST